VQLLKQQINDFLTLHTGAYMGYTAHRRMPGAYGLRSLWWVSVSVLYFWLWAQCAVLLLGTNQPGQLCLSLCQQPQQADAVQLNKQWLCKHSSVPGASSRQTYVPCLHTHTLQGG
jgi:hypothetical protein